MKRKLIFLTIAAILIAQPLMVVNLGTFATDMSTPEISETFSPAQGTRLAPGDHTNHVPIFINKTADFVTQGWPGSGTSGDPYVISGLNITYANGMVSIEIRNTDAYFVIRDCYINQGSTEWGIELNYATHGTVEYTTVNSAGQGLFLNQANFTTISHCDILADDYAIEMIDSTDSVVEWSIFNSTTYRSAWFEYSPNLVVQHNSFDSTSGWFGLTINYSNDTVVNHNTVTDSFTGLNTNYCFNLDVYNHSITDSEVGFSIINCPWIKINTSSALTQLPLNMADSPNATISDSIFEGVGITNTLVDISNSGDLLFARNIVEGGSDNGFDLSDSPDSVIEENSIIDCSPNGITVSFSDDVQVLSNIVEGSNGYGIGVSSSQRIILDSNNLSMIGSDGFFVSSSHNGTLSDNILNEIGSDGFYLDTGENWTIDGNYFTDCQDGVVIESADNVEIFDNDFSLILDSAIDVSNCDYATIHNNNITDAESGILVSSGDWIDIFDNVVSNVLDNGIALDASVNSTVNQNVVSNSLYAGIYLESVSNVQVHLNSLSECVYAGLGILTGLNLTLTNNTFALCGMAFDPTNADPIQYFNHSIANNVVNGQPLYYGKSVDGGTINAADYGQIILFDFNGTSITGTSFDRCTIPVQLFYSLLISVDNMTSSNNAACVLAYESSNTTITNTLVYGYPDYETAGVYLGDSDYFHVSSLETYDCYAGILITDSDYGYLLDSTFTRGEFGIYTIATSHTQVVDNCRFLHTEDDAAYIAGNSWNVTNSYFYNITQYGIYLLGGDYNYFADNYFEHCSRGIYVSGSSTDYGNITNNEIYSCYYGIYISSGDVWGIHNNTVLWSGEYGIYLSGSSASEVYYNTIGLSGSFNGMDTAAQYWDDTVNTGNSWSDYGGTPPYIVGIWGASDRYPSQYLPTSPVIDDPLDIYYAEGTTGNEITWMVYDDYLKNYTVTIDGELWESDASPETSYAEITVNVDGFAYGDHLLEMVVWDVDGNNVTTTLTIHVFDETPPEINTPPNIEAFVEATGQTITWAASDLNPGDYSLLQDDVEVETGTWVTGNITVSVDGLDAGVYAFRMVVYDLDSNPASDTVLVLVIADDEAPTIDHPADITFVVGTTGNRIVWTPSDDNPSSFEIGSNSSVYASGNWAGSRIVLDLDGLAEGEHTFTILVYDGTGNSASDAVRVTVTAQATTTTDVPLDVGLILVVLGSAGGVIVVIVVLYILKKKTAKP
ncbi:MAG: right-handed parallel beta-helix repeat-containing protein [Candidatus Thorarchaeota archaeon]